MSRTLHVSLSLLLALIGFASAAQAHESDWNKDDAKETEVPAPVPVPTSPIPDSQDWPDPYEAERAFGGFLLSGGVAYFAPFDGDDRGGPGAALSGMYQFPTGHFRIGAELFHREYETQWFNVEDVDTDTYEINLIGHYVVSPGKITPYLGAGIGVHINDIDGREIERKDPTLEIEDDTGAGFGLFALLGLEVPITDRIALFGEGRLHLSYQVVGSSDVDCSDSCYDDDDDDTINTGGGSGLIGLRVRF